MATADELLAGLQLSDEDKRAAAIRALMMASAAAFASNDGRPMGSVLGATMFSGLRGYDDSLHAASAGRRDQLTARKQANELAAADKAQQDQKMLAEAMRGAASQGSQDMGPPASFGSQGAPASSARDQERRMLQNTINSLIAQGGGHLIGPLQDRLVKLEPQLDSVKTVTDPKTGKRVQVKVFKDGTEQVSGFDPDKEKLHFADNGQQTGIAMDPFSGEVVNPGVQREMTPGEREASFRSTQQFNRGRQQYDADRGGIVNLDTGEFRPAMQGDQPVAPRMPEAQKKELMTIDTQMRQVQGALDAVKTSPQAFGMARGAATMGGSISESMAGRFDSPAESQARSYVYNVVSKVINERAGAAQSKQELARLRSFLPGELDSAQQIQNKLEGFQQYLSDSRAGTSAPISAQPPAKPSKAPAAGTVDGDYVFLGGDPADKRNWKRK